MHMSCCQLTPPSCAAEGGRMDGLVSFGSPTARANGDWCSKLKLYISAFCSNLPCFAFWLSLLGNVPATCDIASNANADTTLNWHSEPELKPQKTENQRWHAQRYTPDIEQNLSQQRLVCHSQVCNSSQLYMSVSSEPVAAISGV